MNILGCHKLDWSEEAVKETESWLEDAGFRVLSRWGARETAANLKESAAAAVNLVVNISGLRLARYMEQEFGIPYVVGAPFGAGQCAALLKQLQAAACGNDGGLMEGDGQNQADRQSAESAPSVLVIGEQLEAEAIRSALLDKGYGPVRALSFFEMDKALMQPGDRKLISEDELSEQLECESLKIVFGDTDYRLEAGRDLQWIPLANLGNSSPTEPIVPFSLVGEALDHWMEEQGI